MAVIRTYGLLFSNDRFGFMNMVYHLTDIRLFLDMVGKISFGMRMVMDGRLTLLPNNIEQYQDSILTIFSYSFVVNVSVKLYATPALLFV